MLRKSVETRDWLNTVEPRTVRAVMKRVVEETTCIDAQVTTSQVFNPLTKLDFLTFSESELAFNFKKHK
jgi:hypothetical protein